MTPLPFHSSRSALIALLAGAALACASVNPVPPPAPAPAPASQPPYAAYVLLVEATDHTPTPFARVIVASGQPCPTLSGGPTPLGMTRRDNPHGFTVDVCEAVVPFEQPLAVSGSSLTLPPVHRKVSRVAIIGDTGSSHRREHAVRSELERDGRAELFERTDAIEKALGCLVV